jgi:hypothetical protein
MTLTTQTGISATETIHTDVRPGNVRLPNGQIVSEELSILLDKSIVAKPLGIPAQEQIRIKNHAYRYRWVNRLGQGGSWYMRMKMAGWQNATLDDADPMSVELTTDNGEIRMFDTILMKIPLEKWQGAIKYNTQRALQLQRDKRYIANEKMPSQDVMSDEIAQVASVSAAAEADNRSAGGQYIKSFTPTEEELDAKMGKDKKARS